MTCNELSLFRILSWFSEPVFPDDQYVLLKYQAGWNIHFNCKTNEGFSHNWVGKVYP